jgi:hypothetical protein
MPPRVSRVRARRKEIMVNPLKFLDSGFENRAITDVAGGSATASGIDDLDR